VNRLLAKSADPKASAAEEIASLELSQTRYFTLPQTTIVASDPTATGFYQPLVSKEGPVEAALRVAPDPAFHLDGRISYDTAANQVTGTSISAAYFAGKSFVNATWFASRPILAAPLLPGSVSPDSDSIRFAAGVELSKTLRVDTQWNYDARQNLLLEDRSLITYRGSCYTVFFELRQLRLPSQIPRRDIRLVINLKDIGTLLDMHQSVNRIFGQ
jgi:lipopolysaccharide assembly outer membrane protein LptD (OstA)